MFIYYVPVFESQQQHKIIHKLAAIFYSTNEPKIQSAFIEECIVFHWLFSYRNIRLFGPLGDLLPC